MPVSHSSLIPRKRDAVQPQERGNCALCNETLIHLVKTAEFQTGAGTATVASVMAEEMNRGAAPGDRASSDQLRDRVRRQEGAKDDIWAERPNKPADAKDDDEPAYYTPELAAVAAVDILAKGKSDTLPNDIPSAPPEPPFNHRPQGTGEKDMIRLAQLTDGRLAGEDLAETELLGRGRPLRLRITKLRPWPSGRPQLPRKSVSTAPGEKGKTPIRTPWICRMRSVGRVMRSGGRSG